MRNWLSNMAAEAFIRAPMFWTIMAWTTLILSPVEFVAALFGAPKASIGDSLYGFVTSAIMFALIDATRSPQPSPEKP